MQRPFPAGPGWICTLTRAIQREGAKAEHVRPAGPLRGNDEFQRRLELGAVSTRRPKLRRMNHSAENFDREVLRAPHCG